MRTIKKTTLVVLCIAVLVSTVVGLVGANFIVTSNTFAGTGIDVTLNITPSVQQPINGVSFAITAQLNQNTAGIPITLRDSVTTTQMTQPSDATGKTVFNNVVVNGAFSFTATADFGDI